MVPLWSKNVLQPLKDDKKKILQDQYKKQLAQQMHGKKKLLGHGVYLVSPTVSRCCLATVRPCPLKHVNIKTIDILSMNK